MELKDLLMASDEQPKEPLKRPIYGQNGRQLNKERKKLTKKQIIMLAVFAAVFLLIASIYLPQFFMKEKDNKWLTQPNADALQLRTAQILMQPDADYDGDGLTNAEEQALGTRIYSNDSDRDGIHDKEDSRPNQDDGSSTRALMTSGGKLDAPFEMNGVILWADNESSFTNGGVLQTMNGYHFHDFKGYAKFGTGKYAYEYRDGRHTPLSCMSTEGSWRIGENVRNVTVTETQPETTNKFSVFGAEIYIRNGFGDFLSSILPDKGWLTCQNMWVEDTFISASRNVLASRLSVPYDRNDLTRFTQCTNSLADLVDIYRTLDDGSAVLVSLVNSTHGECILEVVGYTATGNLIVADPSDLSVNDYLEIRPMCRRSVKADGSIYLDTWFEFYGCGFDSEANNDTISFFAAAVSAAADVW